MSSKKKKEKKKEKKKKSEIQETEKTKEDQDEMKKSGIFSKIDMIDSATKEESRVIEAKLRRGLIESEQIEKEEKKEESKTNISEIKKQIEELRELKQKYYDEKDSDKAIEISKIIIDMAIKDNLKLIINEEKDFISEIQNEISSRELLSDKIENLKKEKHHHYINGEYKEAIQIATEIIDLAKQLDINSIMREEEKFIDILQDKINQESSQMIDIEKIEDIRDIKQRKIIEDTIKESIGVDLKRPEDKEKDTRGEEKQKFAEEKAKFKQEKREFEETKEAFEWEKQMFEEVKQFGREKIEDEINQKVKLESEIEEREKFEEEKLKFNKEKEVFKQEKLKFENEKDIYWQERQKLEEAKEAFNVKKQQFEEEIKAFEWEKQMFEEAKHFERDKEE